MGAWSGQDSRRARAYLQPMVSAGINCWRCKKPIEPGQKWDADHVIPREFGGAELGLANLRPAHSSCNQRAGGKRAGEIARAKYGKKIKMKKFKPASERGIRGV